MVIKNRKKFIKAIIFIMVITIGLVLIMTNKTFSSQDIKYKTVSVLYGDTLWDIAKKEQNNNNYYKDRDIRDIVENIKNVNSLTNSSLTVDQVLKIPTY